MKPAYHHGDLKRALVEQATACIRAGDEPTQRGLARVLGVSPSAAYRHFADRSELLDAVAAAWLQALGESMRAVPAGASERDLQALCAIYLDAAIGDPHLFRLASGRHGFGRPGGVLGAGGDGPLPQQLFLRAAPRIDAENAWIATHGLAMLSIDGPYSADDARRLLPLLVSGQRPG